VTTRTRHDGLVATAPVGLDAFEAHADLADRGLNFAPVPFARAADDADWHVDERVGALLDEAPGPPQPGGAYEVATGIMERYEFADPARVRAVYDPDSDLEGRDLLLVGRFTVLRFHMGVRIGGVRRGLETVSGRPVHRFRWHYRTLEGHLEQGHMDYEVRKYADTGEVCFLVRAYSRRAEVPNPVVRLGFTVFGRATQLRFYDRSVRRMQRLVEARATPDDA